MAIKLKKSKDEEAEVYGNENFGIPKDCSKKQRFSTAKLVFYLLAVAAICVTGYKYYREIRDFLLPKVTYDKTKQPLIYHTSSGLIIKTPKGESYEICPCVDSEDISSVVKAAQKGKTVYFLTLSEDDGNQDLCTYNIDNETVTVIDKNVSDFKIDTDGKFVVYRKGTTLHFSNINESHIVYENVSDYYLSKNNQVITFFTNEDTSMYTCPTEKDEVPTLVDHNITKVVSPKDEPSIIYYIKDSNLYSKKYGSVRTLIDEKITDAIMLGDSVYFTAEDMYKRPLHDFFTDYKSESDSVLTKPDGADFMKETDGLTIFDEEAFSQANAEYEAKLLRDSIREHIKDNPTKTPGFSLYYHANDSTHRVDSFLATPYLSYNSCRTAMVYKKFESKVPDRYDLANVESIEHADAIRAEGQNKSLDTDMYVVKEDKAPFFAFEMFPTLQIDISLDGKYLYCIESSENETEGLLTRYELGANSLKNRTEICNNVTDFELDGSDSSAVMVFNNNSLSLYFGDTLTHLSDESCRDFFFVDGTLFYYDNYNHDTKSGTLKSIRNGKITTIDKNVYSFNVRKFNSVSYIKDYNPDLGTGTLYTYEGGTTKRQDSHVATIIN